MSHHLKIFVTAILLAYSSIGKGQLLLDNSAPYNDPTYLVQSVLLNTGITISNVTFNGASGITSGARANMIGYFQGANTNIGINSGVLFNTGSIYDAAGPNDSGSDGFDNGEPGDPDLDLASGVPTYNAAVLEFDFETVADAISFRYVFASEEYNEFVCSGFNDGFGFFVSGPGIVGPYSNNSTNIALVPNGNIYVGINTVNNGTPGGGWPASGCGATGLNYPQYFVDNETLGLQTIQYDGFTTVLTAEIDLTPCETYHMKIAVADAGDEIWDSGVFLEAASFGAVGIQVEVGEVGTSSATLVEGCDSILVIFSRAGGTTGPLTIHFNISGSATYGVDYVAFEDSVVIPADSSSISFYLSAFMDSLPEGSEIINITIPANTTNNTCLDDVPSTALITIVNTEPLTIMAIDDTVICAGETVTLLTSVSGGVPGYTYTWTPATDLSCTNCASPIASPMVGTTYTVQVTDDCGTGVATEDIVVNTGGVIVEQTSNSALAVEGCKQASFGFTRFGSTLDPQTIYFTITGTATNGTDYAFITDSIVIPAGQNSVELTLFPYPDSLSETNESVIITTIPDPADGCAIQTTSTITLYIYNVDDITVQASNDTIICGGISTVIQAQGFGGVPTLIYSWHDGTDTVGTGQLLNIQPDFNTTYTVTVSDTCGNPTVTEQVNVIVTMPPPSIASAQNTAYEGCRDASFTIVRNDTSTGDLTVYYTISGTAVNGGDYTTIWDSVIILAGSDSTDIVIQAQNDGNLEVDETVTLTLERDSTDSVCYVIPFVETVIIKSVEPMSVDVLPKDICPGETATLNAVATGGIGPIDYFWNGVANLSSINVSPLDTTFYTIIVSDTCGNADTMYDAMVGVRSILGSVASSGITAYEGCKDTEFIFSIPTALPTNFRIEFTVSGTATEGSDFEAVPYFIIVPAGSLTTSLKVTTLWDGAPEGLESMKITIIPESYADVIYCPPNFEATLNIDDVDPVEIQAMGDTSMCNFYVPLSSRASGGFGPLYYAWDNSGGGNKNVRVNPANTTTYTVTAIDSCQSSVAYDSVLVEVDCEYLFFVPNSFTPNGDGVNDIFNARWKGLKTYQLYIYNRWGDLLFESNDPLEGWNGTSNGGKKLSEQEVYVYVFETTDFLDLSHDYVGKISIIQ